MTRFLLAAGLLWGAVPARAQQQDAPTLEQAAQSYRAAITRPPVGPLDVAPLKEHLRKTAGRIRKDARGRAHKRQQALERYAREFEAVMREATVGRAGTMEVLGLYGKVHGYVDDGHDWYGGESPLAEVSDTEELVAMSEDVVDWVAANRQAVVDYFTRAPRPQADSARVQDIAFAQAEAGELTTVYQENVPKVVRVCESRGSSSGSSSGGPTLLDLIILYHIFK